MGQIHCIPFMFLYSFRLCISVLCNNTANSPSDLAIDQKQAASTQSIPDGRANMYFTKKIILYIFLFSTAYMCSEVYVLNIPQLLLGMHPLHHHLALYSVSQHDSQCNLTIYTFQANHIVCILHNGTIL